MGWFYMKYRRFGGRANLWNLRNRLGTALCERLAYFS